MSSVLGATPMLHHTVASSEKVAVLGRLLQCHAEQPFHSAVLRPVLCVATIAVAFSWATAASATTSQQITLGLGPGLYLEDTTETRETRRLGQATPLNEQDRSSNALTNIHAWVLAPAFLAGLRLGGGMGWFSGYSLEDAEADGDEEPFEVGQVFQLYAQAEYTLDAVVSDLDVLFGFRAGPTLAFAGGQLNQELQSLESQGYNVWSVPRLGGFVAPHVGAAWPLSDRLALRGDLSVQFAAMSLYDVTAEDSGITTEQSLSLSSVRSQLLVGLEFNL